MNLFCHHNRIHDEHYDFGFTETAGNFQLNNFGKGGRDGDAVLGGARRCGQRRRADLHRPRQRLLARPCPTASPSTGMYLWEPIDDAFEGPFRDGDFDATIIQHEYSHGLSNRYVGGGGLALDAQQSGSMGEGWGDWYAMNHLFREGLKSKAVIGAVRTGNPPRGIRNWNYATNPTGFGDFGYDLNGPEVHSDGEIWTATLWDLRKALVARYGAPAGADIAGTWSPTRCRSPRPTRRSSTCATPSSAADLALPGDNFDTLWDAFAQRGAGASATSQGGDDTDPQPGFDHPTGARNGTLVGSVVDAASGAPVADARVIVGDFEARVTPLGADAATGGFSAKLVSGSYDVTIQAPGFGVQTFKVIADRRGRDQAHDAQGAPNLPPRPTARRSCPRPARTPGCPPSSSSTTPRPAPGRRSRRRRPTTPAPTSG